MDMVAKNMPKRAQNPSGQSQLESANERLSVEIGYFGSTTIDPTELFADPTDPNVDDGAELVQLLQERRQLQERPCSLPGMPSSVHPVQL